MWLYSTNDYQFFVAYDSIIILSIDTFAVNLVKKKNKIKYDVALYRHFSV